MKESKKIAFCGMIAALCVAIMLLGQLIGVGMYASPILCGMVLLPVGSMYGKKTHMLTFLATSLLSFMVVSDIEQNLMFVCIFGWYPAIYDVLQKRKNPWRILLKLFIFNVVVIPLQILLCYVLVPQDYGTWMMILLIVLFNVIFLCYDKLIPRMQIKLENFFCRILRMH